TARGLLAGIDDLQDLTLPPGALDWLRTNAWISDFSVVNSESVGPAIGQELRGQAFKAILWSLLAILVYVSIRFRMNYGLGAIVALAHDVIVAVGVLALLGYEFDINVIAALLTLAGYSLNDTIVIFDRVRENLHSQTGSLTELLDESVSVSLSRT